MKKVLMPLSVASIFAACNDSKTDTIPLQLIQQILRLILPAK